MQQLHPKEEENLCTFFDSVSGLVLRTAEPNPSEMLNYPLSFSNSSVFPDQDVARKMKY